jgi:hypothetical protein
MNPHTPLIPEAGLPEISDFVGKASYPGSSYIERCNMPLDPRLRGDERRRDIWEVQI